MMNLKPSRAKRGPRDSEAATRHPPEPVPVSRRATALWGTTFFPAVLGGLLLWAALPPLEWWPLAILAPVPWCGLVRRETLAGRRPYRALWLAGFVFWLGVLHWLCLPHPVTSLGWIALSTWLACFFPLFFALARTAVHRLRFPLLIAAPVAWVGVECLRCYLFSGFGLAMLGHALFRQTLLIQIADLAGAYGVSFVLMFVAACLIRGLPCGADKAAWWPALPAAAIVLATLGYGFFRTQGEHLRPGPRIALVQGNVPQTLKVDSDRTKEVIGAHLSLSYQAADGKPDLIVWPETMWRYPLLVVEPGATPPPGRTTDELNHAADSYRQQMVFAARRIGRPLLLGVDVHVYEGQTTRRHNSAVLVEPSGRFTGRYDKIHRVMFGEYIPVAESFPWLYGLTPLAGGIKGGAVDQPPIPLGNYRLSTSICFESTVPQLIRGQVAQGVRNGNEPDVLVNLTNDGWFWGYSALDLHLACAMFRAVECRKPMLVAANTGLSAWIDADGRCRWQGPRQAEAVEVINVQLDSRNSLYVALGDLPVGLCLAASLLAGVWGAIQSRKRPRDLDLSDERSP